MIKEVDTMPWEGEFPAPTTGLMLARGENTLKFTRKFYEVRNARGEIILAVGVALWNFARPPEMWVMLAKPYFAHLRESLRVSRRALTLPASHYPQLVCEVERGNVVEMHFVKHHGFRPSGRASLRPDGENYIQYEVK